MNERLCLPVSCGPEKALVWLYFLYLDGGGGEDAGLQSLFWEPRKVT